MIRKSFVETFWRRIWIFSRLRGRGRSESGCKTESGVCLFSDVFPAYGRHEGTGSASRDERVVDTEGLRTLSPKNPKYHGHYEGNQDERDNAYHQGTVWPWLIGAYIEANLQLYGKQFLPEAKELLEGFEEDMTVYGLCSVAEVYDGDPPHHPNGSISQAWSVGEILRSMELIRKYEN